MEEKKTIFEYLTQTFCIFGITIIIMSILTQLFGEHAKEISALFLLGNEGIPLDIIVKFLFLSVFITGIRFLFFTDTIIQKMSIILRIIFMIISVVIVIVIFIIVFDWFPINDWKSWTMFFLCFGICFTVSILIMTKKEQLENKKMEEGLKRLKAQCENEKSN